VVAKDKLLFSRYLKVDSAEENWKDTFLDEINKTHDAYLKEVGRELPNKIILTGAEKVVRDLAPVLNLQAGLPVEVLSYQEKIALPDNILRIVANTDYSFVSVMGVALEEIEDSLDLTPQETKNEVKVDSARKERHKLAMSFVVIGAIFSFVFVSEKKPGANTPERRLKLDVSVFRREKKFIFIVASLFVFGLGTLPIALVLLKAREVEHLLIDIPLMYFVYSLTFVFVAIPLGRLADKIGERAVIAFGFLSAAVAYFGLSQTTDLLELITFFVILGIFSAATDGLQRVLAARYVPDELLATGQGFLNMAIGFSSLFAGVIGGLLWTKVNSAAALTYAGIFSVIGLTLFIYMTSDRNSAS